MRAHLKEHIAKIKNCAEKQIEISPRKQIKLTVLTLSEQLSRILQEMPAVQRTRPWSIYELVNQLQGRYRQHPHPQHVARELRALGWTSTRIWSSVGYGKRIWHPPCKQN